MNVIVIDAQGGGVGKQLIEQLKHALPEQKITAVGTNALATAAMLRAGADQGATGENAVRVCAAQADLILGPTGLVLCDAMLGEITGEMALAIGRSPAHKILVPMSRCQLTVAGIPHMTAGEAIEAAVQEAVRRITAAK
ncbi:MAG: DUF3842 family protein [Clostridia bacterium]|nr:DUF3842 family protein [Clostridia bacterium]